METTGAKSTKKSHLGDMWKLQIQAPQHDKPV